MDSLAFRLLLADCLTFSLHRVVALAHSFDLTRYSFSESMLSGGPLPFTRLLSTSFRPFRLRLHIRKAMMTTTMVAASTRDNESMRAVRMVFFSDVLDQPGGNKSVSLVDVGGGVVARSSIPVGPESL